MHQNQNKRGFTIIEVLVAMSIFTLVSMALVWVLVWSLRSNTIIWEQLQTQNDGRRVLQQIVDDARRAEDSSLGAFAIETAESYAFTFYANVDKDSLREKVRYFLEGTAFKRGVIKPSGTPLSYDIENEQVVTLASNVLNAQEEMPIFRYFDENYTGTEDPLSDPVTLSAVRLIKLELELEKDPTASPLPLHVETSVFIRNLKSN